MTTITAKDVGELRRVSGAGMMDCKKALEESAGDFDKAIDYLRKKGQSLAAKRADKETNEGVVVTLLKEGKGIVLGLSCETDFVAKNEQYIELANELAQLAMESSAKTKEEVLALEMDGSTVAEKLVEQTGRIGEKIEVKDYHLMESENIASYIHAGNKIGVIVAYDSGGKSDADEFFRGVAMHIAALGPSKMSPDEWDPVVMEKELEGLIGQIKVDNEDRKRLSKPLLTIPKFGSRSQLTPDVLAQAEEEIKAELKAEGKPEKIWDKIIPGKLERFIADNTQLDQQDCLLCQIFAKDQTGSMTVADAVKDFSADAKVLGFKRISVS